MTEKKNRYESCKTVLDGLNQMAESDDCALIWEDTQQSWRELLRRVKRAAGALCERGVQRGDRIVVRAESFADQIMAALSVLYAGGCFVAVDSSWPKERLDFIERDSQSVLVMDGRTLRELEAVDGSASLPQVRPEDECVVHYTSGSTGMPKGVVLHHAACLGMVLPLESNPFFYLEERNCTRLFFMGNFAYAGTHNNLLFSWLCGKTMILASAREKNAPALAGACMLRHHADGMIGTPSLLSRFLEDSAFEEAVSRLRYLGLTGEALSAPDRDRILGSVRGGVYDLFGCSEVHNFACGLVRRAEMPMLEFHTPGAKIFVLSGDGDQVSPGETGELCVGGIQARYGCYLGRPDLTKEKFEEHPSYGRIYHTGDRAFLCEDGRIRITGRLDGMQKLRGQRLEPREIEMEMERCPGVRRAAVQVRGEGGSGVLCGWYCVSGDVEEKNLRERLFQSLPAYMVPTHLMRLNEMPLNSSGKLDRNALPDIALAQPKDGHRKAAEGAYEAPRTAMEKAVCRCFEKTLKTNRPVGREDNFFLLGGDSIRAMQMISILEREEGVSCTLNDVFRNPTPASLSGEVRGKEKDESGFWKSKVPEEIISQAADENVEAIYPVNKSTLDYLFMEKRHITHRLNEQRLLVTLSCAWSEQEFQERVQRLVRNHPALRSSFLPDSRWGIWQVFQKELLSAVWYRDISALSPDAQQSFLSGFWQAMEPSAALWKAAYFVLGKKESRLLVYARHSIMDGISTQIFLNELCGAGYREYGSDGMLQMRHRLTSMSKEIPAWVREYYANPDLSLQEKVPSTGADRWMAQEIRFSPEETERLNMRCREAGVTLFSLVQYALGQSLLSMRDAGEIWLYVIDSGRAQEGRNAERIIGNLIIPLPVRVKKGQGIREFHEDLLRLRDCPALAESGSFFSAGWNHLHEGIVSNDFFAWDPVIRRLGFLREDRHGGRSMRMEKGCLVLTLRCPDTEAERSRNRELAQVLEKHLQDMVV